MIWPRTPGSPAPVSPGTIAQIRLNTVQIARAQAESVPAYNCFLNGLELGMALAAEDPAMAAELLEALVAMGVEPLPSEPLHRYGARCMFGRHNRVCQLMDELMKGLF